MKISTIFTIIVIAALTGLGIFYLRDTSGPEVALPRDSGPISARANIGLDLRDPGLASEF